MTAVAIRAPARARPTLAPIARAVAARVTAEHPAIFALPGLAVGLGLCKVIDLAIGGPGLLAAFGL